MVTPQNSFEDNQIMKLQKKSYTKESSQSLDLQKLIV